MRRICVFCGSSPGSDPAFALAARLLGQALAEAQLTLVFGGGRVGLMGVLADAVLGAGGQVIGVIPQAMIARELGHTGLTELRVVGSMHERKAVMADLADGFILLPGGAGSLEEFCEIWTWAILGIHRKPCGILNIQGYYDPLLRFLDRMVEKQFLSTVHRSIVLVESNLAMLLDRFATYQAQEIPQWIDRPKT